MKNQDLLRKWILDVDAAGVVTIRQRGKTKPKGLPVWSTDEMAQAIALRARHCEVAMDPRGNLHWQLIMINYPPREVSDLLGRLTPMFRQSYERMLADGYSGREEHRFALGEAGRELERFARACCMCRNCGAPLARTKVKE